MMRGSTTSLYWKAATRSGFSNILSKLCAGLASLALVPLLMNLLGKDGFGVWSLILAVAPWVQLCDLGVGAALLNSVSEVHGRKFEFARASTIKTYMVATALHALMLGLIIESIFVFRGAEHHLSLTILIWTTLSALPIGLINPILTSYGRIDIVNIAQIATSLLTLFGVVIASAWSISNLPAVVFITIAPAIPVGLFLWIFAIRRKIAPHPFKAKFSRQLLRRLYKTSTLFAALQLQATAFLWSIPFVVAYLGGLTAAAEYAIIYRFYTFYVAIPRGFVEGLIPQIRVLYERKDRVQITQLIFKIFSLRLGITLALVAVSFPFADWILAQWTRHSDLRLFEVSGRWLLFYGCLIIFSVSSLMAEILSILDILIPQIYFSMVTLALLFLILPLFYDRFWIFSVFLATMVAVIYPALRSGILVRQKVLSL